MCYYSFNKYLKQRFGHKVRRLSLNAGFSCPHKIDNDPETGCIFCNESGFSPNADKFIPLEKQLEEGIKRIKKKYKVNNVIAYFQNATGTNESVKKLKEAYDVIKNFKEISSLYISTRPDCIDESKLDLISSYSDKYEVWIEYGIQTFHESTLDKINRKHTYLDSIKAINSTAKKNIKIGAHIILGLPGENSDDMIETAKILSGLPVDGVKLHVLHVLKDTKLASLYNDGQVKLLSRDEYIRNACDFMEYLNPECVMFRLVSDAYEQYLVAPDWINDKQAVIAGIKAEFKRRGTKQGSKFKAKSANNKKRG